MRPNFFLLLAAVAGLLGSNLRAQTRVPEGLLVTATTTTSVNGQPWIYVRWQATDGRLPYGTPFMVYIKNGDAASTGPFAEQGLTFPAEQWSSVSALLSRAAEIGTDVAALGQDVAAYSDAVREDHITFAGNAVPPPADPAPVAEKLARLIHQARGDATTASGLRQLALGHPGVALCLGEAWAGRVTAAPGTPVTVELRSWDPAAGRETGIAGRVTLTAGVPVTMLAPGPPVQVPDVTATGDRLIKLRWATSDALRRQFPLSTGFSLWRVTQAEALLRGWHLTAPTAEALRTLVAASPALAAELTDGPLQIGKLFSPAEVGDFGAAPPGDGVTYYYLDDNNRYRRDAAGAVIGTAFPDGAGFHYFAAARDLLGREGAVSPGGPGTACARLAPEVPADFTLLEETRTEGPGGAVRTGFTLRWKANVAADDNDTDRYQIFRGSQASTPGVELSNPATLPPPVAALPHAPLPDGTMTWTDFPAPAVPAAPETFWYAIRAVHASPVAPDNYSRLSPPLYGSLRPSDGPPAPLTALSFSCPLAGLTLNATTAGPFEFVPLDPGAAQPATRTVRLIVERADPGIAWLDVAWNWENHAEPEATRIEFDPERMDLTADFEVPARLATPVTLKVLAGSIAGSESVELTRTFSNVAAPVWPADQVLVLRGRAASPTVAEVRRENADHAAMFLTSNPPGGPAFSIAPVALGDRAFLAPLTAHDHAAYLIEAQRGGVWATVTGVEVSGNEVFFTDPLAPLPDGTGGTPATAWRAQRIVSGETACVHLADRADGSIAPISLRVRFGITAALLGEYRIYRQLDAGPLQLLAQGDGARLPANATEVVRQDTAIPATATMLRNFGQIFNRQGIGSPMVPLGDPILLGRRDVATPVLKAPRPGGTAAAPTVKLEWFCPPDGIERFKVRLDPVKAPAAGAANGGLPEKLMMERRRSSQGAVSALPMLARRTGLMAFRRGTLAGLSGLVGAGREMGAGPVFTTELRIAANTRYNISVGAVSLAGIAGGASRSYPFAWTPPPAPPVPNQEKTVPWPQRALPEVSTWHPAVRAELTKGTRNYPSGFTTATETWDLQPAGEALNYPVGVRIGALRGASSPWYYLMSTSPGGTPGNNGQFVAQLFNNAFSRFRGGLPSRAESLLLPRGTLPAGLSADSPVTTLVGTTQGETGGAFAPRLFVGGDGGGLLPVVLYRQQVPSPRFPAVPGDTVQVSPMIGRIASRYFNNGDGLFLRDPYIGVVTRQYQPGAGDGGNEVASVDLFLLDTQPVVKGARYHYTLLRFSAADGEIIESIDCGEVLIPDTL